MFKKCYTCQAEKPYSCFTEANNICKYCRNNYQRDRRRKNNAYVNSLNRASYYRNKDSRRRAQKKYESKRKELARSDKSIHAKELIGQIRARAKILKIPFDLIWCDIKIPETCPILGMPLHRNRTKMGPDSATVGRIIPSKGYVKSNIVVVSLKANLIKSNATWEEIAKVAEFYKEMDSQNGPGQT